MTSGVVTPDEATFRELARSHRVIPVTRRLLADGETPVGVYRKLAGGPGSFLLESAEQGAASGGSVWSRYSFIGVRSAATLIAKDGETTWLGDATARRSAQRRSDRGAARHRRGPVGHAQPETGEDLPPLTGGLVGFMGYDVVRHFEKLPRAHRRRPAGTRHRHDARDRPRRARPPHRFRAARRERDPRRGRQRVPGRRRRRGRGLPPGDRPARRDDHGPGPPDAAARLDGRAAAGRHARTRGRPTARTRRPSRRRRRRSGPANASRSWSRNGLPARRTPIRSTSIACCG